MNVPWVLTTVIPTPAVSTCMVAMTVDVTATTEEMVTPVQVRTQSKPAESAHITSVTQWQPPLVVSNISEQRYRQNFATCYRYSNNALASAFTEHRSLRD